MPTDPYVPTPLDEKPRQKQNFAAGVSMPPARGWRADRPGDDVAQMPRGPLTGSPGPSVGFALTLAKRSRDRLQLGPAEHADDAVAVVAELAMKRASAFGRAPTAVDIDVASELLGFSGPAPADVKAWRPSVIRGAHHEYVVRRRIADAVDDSVLRRPLAELGEVIADARRALAGVEAVAPTDAPSVEVPAVDSPATDTPAIGASSGAA